TMAYGSWLLFLVIDLLDSSSQTFQALPLTPLSEALLGCVGLALLAIALLLMRANMGLLLPRI
ncbi:MAG TPA: hypothetical protein VKQ36_16835, partial [Ktedonobacterales bacterium]|nr:hypothetical protein [Ktedonobacterales bacterium]